MSIWTDADIIHRYTRAQAIEDGVLVDVSTVAREAGIVVPVAITRTVWEEVITPDPRAVAYGQSIQGRLWDAVYMLAHAVRRGVHRGSDLTYGCYFIMKARQRRLIRLTAKCGPGDHGEPVITITDWR